MSFSSSRARGWGLVCLVAVVCLSFATVDSHAQMVKVADEVFERIETPHPYPKASKAGGQAVWSHTLHWPDASFIAVHFEEFDLAPGDTVTLANADGTQVHTYHGRGYKDLGTFWALSIFGDTMKITLNSQTQSTHDSFGLAIDVWTHGYPHDPDPETEALCGAEDFRDVECYKDTYPVEYDKARAAVKLLQNGSSHCTGWLASCENHIVTNEHCVGSQSQLNNIEFQFEYKRPSCGSGTPAAELQIPGGTLLEVDAGLDYALIMPDLQGNDPQATYGFYQWDVRLPDDDELIYIPGHPSGDPKRLSIDSTHATDPSGRCEIFSSSEPTCTGGPVPEIGYYCDTEGGSSGSAVLAVSSHKVIALHHCANCPNRGNPIIDIYNDIQASPNPLPGCVTCESSAAPTDLVTSVPADNEVMLDWIPVPGALHYNIYRSTGDCDTGMTKIAESTSASYLDTDVAGGFTYYYKVTAVNDCAAESPFSNCASAEPSGECTEAPRFDGLLTAGSATTTSCGIDLDWNAATARCGTVRYNVYRSIFPNFEPAAGNLVESCLTTTSYTDTTVLNKTPYYYVVRAEDDTTTGAGNCSGGNEDSNTVWQSSRATGPEIPILSQDFEGSFAGWILNGEWQVAPGQQKGGSDGGGVGSPDPVGGNAGPHVLGHDISGLGAHPGNYEPGLSAPEVALSPQFDATGHTETILRFQRWLGAAASPSDKSTVDVFDGNGWVVAWENPAVPLYDTEWVTVELDVSDQIANNNLGRIRFSQTSNSDGAVAAGWNVDGIELFEPDDCESGSPNVPPVPDGKFVPGAEMTAVKSTGQNVTVTWDVTTCPASTSYHMLRGDSDDLTTYTYNGGSCLIGTSGTVDTIVPTPAPGKFTWWTIVGVDGTTEGGHGYDSDGGLRPATGVGLCGIFEQSIAGTCESF